MDVKAVSAMHKVLFALLALVTVSVFLFSMWLSWLAPAKEKMRALVQHKEDILLQAAADAGGRYVDRQHADTVNLQAFAQTALTDIDARSADCSVVFSFVWTYRLGETTIRLLYLPADSYTAPDTGEWSLTSSSDNAWRWDGGGMLGKGYIIVERFQENWFYVEKCYPT